MMDYKRLRVGFIGIGVLGKGLALALAEKGYSIEAVYSRSAASAEWLSDRISGCRVCHSAQELAELTDVVFITTPDSVIGRVAESINWRTGQAVVHCSGSQSTDVLSKASKQGASTGSFHPFQTFAGLTEPEEAVSRLSGVTFAIDGEGWLEEFLFGAARDLKGHPVKIPDESRALYHASAILGCGYLAALMQSALIPWRAMGFSEQEALSALVPLATATIENIGRYGVVDSVPGPLVRGDLATVESHLEALGRSAPEALPVYAALTTASLPLAEKRGVDAGQIEQIRKLIDDYRGRYTTCPE